MNKSLCALICFLIGVLVYSLIRSYCSCDVVEGLLGRHNSKSNRLEEISSKNCKENNNFCFNIQNDNMCGGRSTVDICNIDDTTFEKCKIYNSNSIPVKCDTDDKKLKWVQWFTGFGNDIKSCPGITKEKEPCSGGRKPPVPPGPPVPPSPPVCPDNTPSQPQPTCASPKVSCAIGHDDCTKSNNKCCKIADINYTCDQVTTKCKISIKDDNHVEGYTNKTYSLL